MSDIMVECGSCKEEIPINAIKCKHCSSENWQSRAMSIGMAIFGLLLMPVSLFALFAALGGVGGLIGIILLGAIGLLGPLFMLAGVGGYIQRRQSIKEVRSSGSV